MMYLFIYYYQLYNNTTYDIIKEKLRNHNIIKLKDKLKSHDIYDDDVDVKEEETVDVKFIEPDVDVKEGEFVDVKLIEPDVDNSE